MQDQARHFLFLQGPHGPFFARLAGQLTAKGHRVTRIGLNAADRIFWPWRFTYQAFKHPQDAWHSYLDAYIQTHSITDVVLYGDVRTYHRIAVACAGAHQLRVHVFEEGYLRPYWITYERGGSNGHSRLMDLSVKELVPSRIPAPKGPPPPTNWGDLRQHVFYGALYHGLVLLGGWAYPTFVHHRPLPLMAEWKNYALRLLSLPWSGLRRAWDTARLLRRKQDYFIVLLQLEHDSAMQEHSPYQTHHAFAAHVIQEFAQCRNTADLLVFKCHPLEARTGQLRRDIRSLAKDHKIAHRVVFLGGGKLAAVLDRAKAALTLNSTAGQQVLLRGKPLKAYGRAIYSKPAFVSRQTTQRFFEAPKPPNRTAYRKFRQYLLETSQITGGFYASKGRSKALPKVVEKMLQDVDPYGP